MFSFIQELRNKKNWKIIQKDKMNKVSVMFAWQKTFSKKLHMQIIFIVRVMPAICIFIKKRRSASNS